MAVPLTGPLSQLKLAREAKHADYNGSQSMGVISLYDLVNGGQANGSTVDYPTVNTNCEPNPADRGSYVTVLQVKKLTSPNTFTGPFTYYLNPSQAATPGAMANGDTMYSDAALTTPLPLHTNGYWFQDNTGLNASQLVCSNTDDQGAWDTNASGVIASFTCGIP